MRSAGVTIWSPLSPIEAVGSDVLPHAVAKTHKIKNVAAHRSVIQTKLAKDVNLCAGQLLEAPSLTAG